MRPKAPSYERCDDRELKLWLELLVYVLTNLLGYGSTAARTRYLLLIFRYMTMTIYIHVWLAFSELCYRQRGEHSQRRGHLFQPRRRGQAVLRSMGY